MSFGRCTQPLLKNAKVLQQSELGGESLQALMTSVQEQCLAWNIDAKVDVAVDVLKFPCVTCLKLFGIFWTEEEFVEQATHAETPSLVGCCSAAATS